MKVLFLDVDGVLNNTRSRSLYALSRPALRRLQCIVDETGCKIVVSSTWRKDEQALNRLGNVLFYRGLSIHDVTPNHQGKPRGFEIWSWLDQHPEVNRYCILDDDSDMLDSQLRYFVQTDPDYGLTDTLTYRVIYRLNNEVRTY